MSGFVVEQFVPMKKNSLLGFATVRAPSGMVIHDVCVLRKGDSVWASPPSKPLLGRDGMQRTDDSGKPRWQPVVSFASKDIRDKWSAAVIAAVEASHPEALA